MYFRQGIYEFTRLMEQRWNYGERIFSAALIGMLVATVVGWRYDRLAAALLMAGYVLAAASPFFGDFTRPMLGDDPRGIALVLSPFLVVGIAYAWMGKARTVWD